MLKEYLAADPRPRQLLEQNFITSYGSSEIRILEDSPPSPCLAFLVLLSILRITVNSTFNGSALHFQSC